VADVFLQMAEDFTSYAINHPGEARRQKVRNWFLKTLDYANACGCEHVTTLPGVHFETEAYADSFARSVDELAWRVEQAKQRGIIFGIEAHVGSIVSEPASAERLVQAVPGLTLTLDYTHFTRLGMPDSAVEPLVMYASHFHVRGAREGRLQERFPLNTIDYLRVYKIMQATGYAGWIGIEYVWIDWERCNECDNVSETIQFRDYFRSLIS
jgi:sugar phosphate isomerase/epimerase